MNRKIIIGIIVAAGVLLLATIVVLVVVWQKTLQTNSLPEADQPLADNSTNSTVTVTTSTTDTTVPETVVPVEQDDRQAITATTRSFTERYGSYSSDTNFENVERSRYLMTEAMSKQADKVIKQGQASAEFTSVTSEVTSVTLTDFADGATGATVEVAVRQKTIVGQQDPTYQNVTARLTLKKVNNGWKIDTFRWL